ncbi:pancreatic triacylglycerol lipase [Agrilus planipennis]|uniref:Pancreatic triacylglycerol lipase n=1 Tax=Agrilus planipennis TaxID=224129 RepID=A0A1W4XTY6_AGRPL|nr:pancreatic triacylglycerol lipase [Agrilus planipennis]XP_018335885.1 pancreatic triacylglycerol lipase [Agrilus planipennis]XP_025828987.1 pancreatic triacylglycerol lipase [Agrilus planipennis]
MFIWRMKHSQFLVTQVLVLSASIASAGIFNLNWDKPTRLEINIPWLFVNEERCYEELGCLNITRSWYHIIHRPINVFPLPRSVINTRFILFTRNNPNQGQELRASDDDTIQKSNFEAQKKTKFIIHGFIDTSLSNWVGEMKDELLKNNDMNVFVVDWAGGSLPLYTQATANTRLVGLEVAHFINHLIKTYSLNAGNVHIIGHSLGAHTAGYAGSRIAGLGRITGLDPAEPYFQGMPAHVRLDSSDAEMVDVIHTDGRSIILFGYGMSEPCGHLDFYPNNGKEQPGCEITQTPLIPLTLIKEGLEEASRVLVACNHIRALKLFTDSINSQCQYVAQQCPSYEHFVAGKCFGCKSGGGNCAIMGYHADASPMLENEVSPQTQLMDMVGSKFFTMTGSEFPFCHRMYRVAVELAKPAYAETWVQGIIRASIFAPQGVINVDLTPQGDTKLEHGTTYAIVVSHPADLGGNVKKVELSWQYDMNVLEPRTLCLLWCNDHLYVNSVSVDEMELPGRGRRNVQFSNKLCSVGRKNFSDIANRGRGVFLKACKEDEKTIS